MPNADLERSFSRSVDEGKDRLDRSNSTLWATGLVGGLDIGIGLLAFLLVLHETGSHLAGSLAFGLGFLVLTLARSELFTENFLVPIVAVIADRTRIPAVLRLWSVSLVANLLGGLLLMGLVFVAHPALHEVMLESGSSYPDKGLGLESFALAVLGGAAITLLTWMQQSESSSGVKAAAAWVFGSLLVLGELNHSVVISLKMFAAMMVGAPFGVLDWLALLGLVVLGNIVGGIVLVTPLRTLQVDREHVVREQRRAARETANERQDAVLDDLVERAEPFPTRTP